MSQKKKSAFGVQFTGKVTFQGPMFDIHDNEHVHLETARFIKPGNVEDVEEENVELSEILTKEDEDPKHLWCSHLKVDKVKEVLCGLNIEDKAK